MKQWILLVLALASLSASPSTQPVPPVWDGEHWNLGSVHGTAAEVGDQVNGEVRRLSRRQSEIRQSADEERQQLAKLQARCIARLHASEDYKAKKAAFDAASASLAEARRDHDSQNAIIYSSRVNHLRADLAGMERTAVADDRAIAASGERVRQLDVDAAAISQSLADAQKWRDERVDATRNSLRLRWPLRPGDVGLIGPIKRVESAQLRCFTEDRVVIYAMEWGETVSKKEDIITGNVLLHPLFVRLSGGGKLDDPDMAVCVDDVHRDIVLSIETDADVYFADLTPVPSDPIAEVINAMKAP